MDGTVTISISDYEELKNSRKELMAQIQKEREELKEEKDNIKKGLVRVDYTGAFPFGSSTTYYITAEDFHVEEREKIRNEIRASFDKELTELENYKLFASKRLKKKVEHMTAITLSSLFHR